MKRLRSHLIGVDQGEVLLFSDFEAGGAMWTGEGARERRRAVVFSERFRGTPAVQVSVALWDLDHSANLRGELRAESVTAEGFEIVFRTWSDSRIARLRVAWTAIGELPHGDDWEL